jgi:LL-diaminopimelate aminotransferase
MYKNGKKPEEIIKNCEIYKERRDLVVSRLREMGISVDTPKATIYVWAQCPEKMKKSFDFNTRLMDGGVMVTPGAGFGSESEGYFRIALVEPLEKLKVAMERMEKVIQSL